MNIHNKPIRTMNNIYFDCIQFTGGGHFCSMEHTLFTICEQLQYSNILGTGMSQAFQINLTIFSSF